jgi:hypothetical protein
LNERPPPRVPPGADGGLAAVEAALGRLVGEACVASGGPLRLSFASGVLQAACSWRLEAGDEVLHGEAATGRVDGAVLRSVALAPPAGDVVLGFDCAKLRLFCERRASGQTFNWRLAEPGRAWRADAGGRPAVEPGGEWVSRTETIEALREAVGVLTGERCWCAASAGPHGGLMLGFGRRHERPFVLDDLALPDALRTHFPERMLQVDCSWRLEVEDGVLCSARDALVRDGRLAAGLARLEGAIVASVSLDRPALDLALRLEDGATLRLFADRVDGGECDYTLALADGRWSVGPAGRVRQERRDPPLPHLELVK